MNTWENIWNNRKLVDYKNSNIEELFIKMKVVDGYDAMGKLHISFEDFEKQFVSIIEGLSIGKLNPIESLYEVGCGCGPNLLLAKRLGLKFGGSDYSENMIRYARDILGNDCDLTACEASSISTEMKYDAVISKGVFGYFANEDYCFQVMKKMVYKSNYSIGIYDIHDKEREREYINDRRRRIPDYDKKYNNLNKLFLSKDFFIDFAKNEGLKIAFRETNLNGYWNEKYTYNVVFYKNNV